MNALHVTWRGRRSAMVDGSVHDRQFGCKVQKTKACVAPFELEWRSLPRDGHRTASLTKISLYASASCDRRVDLRNAHMCSPDGHLFVLLVLAFLAFSCQKTIEITRASFLTPSLLRLPSSSSYDPSQLNIFDAQQRLHSEKNLQR